MKYFIVNVNNCLPISHYEPFFYEHIHRGELVFLEEIEDTCQLEKTYHELVAHRNRNPFTFEQSVILLFIPRDFALSLQPQDYELYNDMNTYMHLLLKLSDKFTVYTFYVDRTGELEQNDAAYQKLNAVNNSMMAQYPELKSYFLPTEADCACEGDYRDYLRSCFMALSPCTRNFYLHMLKTAPNIQGSPTQFQNGINNFVGESKRILSEVKHIYAPIYRMELAEEIEEWLKIIHYIKDMLKEQLLPEQMPAYEAYSLQQTEHIRRLLATYRYRLSMWDCAKPEIPNTGTCTIWSFPESSNAAAAYHELINSTIEQNLKRIGVGNVGTRDAVDRIFDELSSIVTGAWDQLLDFTDKQSEILLNPDSYRKVGKETFSLEKPDREDEQAELAALEASNRHSAGAGDIPDFSAENRLEQELEVINNQINQILENLKVYKLSSFLVALIFSLVTIAGLYAGAQYSILTKEQSWWILGLYLLISGCIFNTAYITVRRKYTREVGKLLSLCVNKVSDFLRAFQHIAEDFEKNIHAAGRYNCLKKQLDEKASAREAYRETMQKYAWHKMKVKQILRNLTYFDSFIGDALPYEESAVTLECFDHAPEHTEFYQLKEFHN